MEISQYVTFDLPVPYRGLLITPATVRDYMLFNAYVQVLLIEKNLIPDIKIITMTDLEYMYYATQEDMENTPYLLWFDRLLAICLRNDKSFEDPATSIHRYKYDDKGKPIFVIGEEVYDSSDFIKIRDIICSQNLIDQPDRSMSKEVKDSLDAAMAYKRKLSGSKGGSFEDYIISLSIATGWKPEYIYDMTIRKFIMSVRRLDNLIHYKIYLSASMSGMVEFKDKSFIKHWLTDLDDKNKYEDVALDLDKVKGQISLESAK